MANGGRPQAKHADAARGPAPAANGKAAAIKVRLPPLSCDVTTLHGMPRCPWRRHGAAWPARPQHTDDD
jgi:hypothetical protein